MKEIRNIPQLSIVRILYICILLLHLLALGVNAQIIKPVLTIKAGAAVGPANPQISRVREIYTSQIGVREKQPNSGPAVEQYLRYVNLPKGNPWCAAFVCWTLGQAGVGNPRTGWSPGLFQVKRIVWERDVIASAARQWEQGTAKDVIASVARQGKLKVGGSIRSKEGPRTADIFGLYFPEKGRIAHVGFIDEWNEPWVTTVEGNINVLGSREEDGVYRKRRLVRSVYKVARYID